VLLVRASSGAPTVRPSSTVNSTTPDLLSEHYVPNYIYTSAAAVVAYGQHQKLVLTIANLGKENMKALSYHILHTATKGTFVANFTKKKKIKVD